ncbi:hypothetical protein [uncultured Maritalea sp.]|uniref:hypothetical protein n=1 Tax=uncultured Maritalea sp. TaxID=757249 RepID=UPI00262716F6|nr:hypothetical protein [uncultured Maritalea sp.]
MKTRRQIITTPQLDLALEALELANEDCRLAAEPDTVGASGIRGTLPATSSATIRHTALTVVQNKKRMRKSKRTRVDISKGGNS